MVVVVGNHAALRGDRSPQRGQNLSGDIAAVLESMMMQTTEQQAFALLISLNELAHFVDRLNAVQVALALSPSPREQSVAPEEDSFRARIALHRCFEHQCQFETWPLPGQPYNLSPELAIEFFQFALAVGARSDGNRPIRMKMVNVIVGNECVQRRID